MVLQEFPRISIAIAPEHLVCFLGILRTGAAAFSCAVEASSNLNLRPVRVVRFSTSCRLELERADFSTIFPIYKMICKLCSNKYIGESSRSLHDRLREHLRHATNPSANSYKDEVMAVYHVIVVRLIN